jgi:isopentenyl diphosphate isomerase/L-lactate dehydrogenase-like FMN-dependent dehydrogenase
MVDGVVLSNHGGRQLDQTIPPIDALPQVRDAVGDSLEVYVDSGIRRGTDLVIALARGATGCLVGRPYLYGLMAGGRPGVDRAIEILTAQIERTMRLLGVRTLDELEPSHVTMLERLAPRLAR